jgi:hypothetical protein
MALYVAGDFSSYSSSWAIPSDYDGDPLYTGAFTLILSTGVNQEIFDALSTGMKCIHYMSANDLYTMMPNEDVIIVNLRAKLLVFEATYINQKLLNNYVFKYDTSGKVQAVSRTSSVICSLEDAYTSVGWRCTGVPWDTGDFNSKVETNRPSDERPRVQCLDLYYKHPSDPPTSLTNSPVLIPGEV